MRPDERGHQATSSGIELLHSRTPGRKRWASMLEARPALVWARSRTWLGPFPIPRSSEYHKKGSPQVKPPSGASPRPAGHGEGGSFSVGNQAMDRTGRGAG